MTIRFLADENFDHKTLASIKRHDPGIDIIAVQEAELRTTDDPDVLECAAWDGRIVERQGTAELCGAVQCRMVNRAWMRGR